MKYFYLITVIIIGYSLLFNSFAQQPMIEKWTKTKSKQWFEQKSWAGGLQLEPNKHLNIVEFAKQYHANKNYWDKAFAFLKQNDLNSLAIGKYPIDGDKVFATITENATLDYDKTQWESHKKYIDIQYVIKGEELIGINPVSKSIILKTYDTLKDVINYTAKKKIYVATPASFFIFFPSDAHRPNITPGGNLKVKKVVIKMINEDIK